MLNDRSNQWHRGSSSFSLESPCMESEYNNKKIKTRTKTFKYYFMRYFLFTQFAINSIILLSERFLLGDDISSFFFYCIFAKGCQQLISILDSISGIICCIALSIYLIRQMQKNPFLSIALSVLISRRNMHNTFRCIIFGIISRNVRSGSNAHNDN